MPRSAAQSDFVVQASAPEEELPAGPVGEATGPARLPRGAVRSSFASDRATRFVMSFTFIVLGVLVLLTLIGPHVPAGE